MDVVVKAQMAISESPKLVEAFTNDNTTNRVEKWWNFVCLGEF
jgi:hypothetical protein